MDFTGLLKSSTNEITGFAKRNAANMAIIGDLQAARDTCKTKEARAIIEGHIVPMQKQLQKQCAAFDAKMSSIWKGAKGEKIPADVQKKLNGALEGGVKSMKSKTGPEIKHNSDANHKNWINVLSF